MVISEKDLSEFNQKIKEVNFKPEVVIGICIGFMYSGSRFGSEHHPFIVEKSGQIIGEFDTLDEALSIPAAVPYGSTPLCTSCAKLKIG
jgi:hypothetical protein